VISMSTEKYTYDTAVRMVGNLLKYHPAVGSYARNKNGDEVSFCDPQASCFCYMGALHLVSLTTGVSFAGLAADCRNALTTLVFGPSTWDGGTDSQRAEWANKLANYKA
jgi:hypothetical protein